MKPATATNVVFLTMHSAGYDQAARGYNAPTSNPGAILVMVVLLIVLILISKLFESKRK